MCRHVILAEPRIELDQAEPARRFGESLVSLLEVAINEPANARIFASSTAARNLRAEGTLNLSKRK